MRDVSFGRYWQQTEPPWDQPDVPWIVRIAARWGIVVVGLLAAEAFVNWVFERDRFFIGEVEDLLAAGAIFVVLRAIVRPVLIFLTCPLQLITLGLFLLVVNAIILILTDEIADWFGVVFEIDGFWAAFIGALVVSAVSFVLSRPVRRGFP